MPERPTHPSPDELSAYGLGQLSANKAEVVEKHISECEPCCETIADLAADDTFLVLLQDARSLPDDRTDDHDRVSTEASSSMPVPVELTEHPRYEVLCLIGKGGMGDVYKARHCKMERMVAVKVINRELVGQPEAVDRFHREVRTAAQLTHRNIVTAYDADQAGGFHFLVMEYVDGIDLSRTVKDRGALPIRQAADYIRQAAIGLQQAHELDMVHRDIKPHNLMVTAEGTVKILDFGLAALAPEAVSTAVTVEARGDLTAAGSFMGTPDFVSPDQASDASQADIRSDIYSLGATFYYLLSGRPPFADGSVVHKLKCHRETEPEPLESLRGDITPSLAAVVSRMMAKNPDDRFQTPAAVAEALESNLQSSPEGDSEVLPAATRPRSRVKKVGLSLLGLAILILAGVLLTTGFSTDNDLVADKLAAMPGPLKRVDPLPPNTVPITLYTIGKETLDGTRPAAICEIGPHRIVLLGQDIEKTRNVLDILDIRVAGQTKDSQSAATNTGFQYFDYTYEDGEATCQFFDYKFRLANEKLYVGGNSMVWDDAAAPGLLILVDKNAFTTQTRNLKQAATPSRASAADLVKQLGDTSATLREQATKSLIAAGPQVLEALKAAPESESLDFQARVNAVLREIESPIFVKGDLEQLTNHPLSWQRLSQLIDDTKPSRMLFIEMQKVAGDLLTLVETKPESISRELSKLSAENTRWARVKAAVFVSLCDKVSLDNDALENLCSILYAAQSNDSDKSESLQDETAESFRALLGQWFSRYGRNIRESQQHRMLEVADHFQVKQSAAGLARSSLSNHLKSGRRDRQTQDFLLLLGMAGNKDDISLLQKFISDDTPLRDGIASPEGDARKYKTGDIALAMSVLLSDQKLDDYFLFDIPVGERYSDPRYYGFYSESRRRAALQKWTEWGYTKLSREEIQARLRRLSDSRLDQSRARKLITDLGSDQFSTREAAEQALKTLPVIPLDLLEEAVRNSDAERAFRAKKILEYEVARQRQSVTETLRAVEFLKLSGLMQEIFTVVTKFQDEEKVVRSAKNTILAVVTKDDIPFLSSQLTPETIATLQDMSVAALRQLEDATLADQFEEWAGNEELKEDTRLQSALSLSEMGDRRTLNLLLKLMVEASSPSVRGRSALALRTLTGQRFEFYAYAQPEVRDRAAEPWRKWIAGDGKTADLKNAPQAARPKLVGHTLVALWESRSGKGGTVIEYDESMNEIWRYDCSYPNSVEKMVNGNVLIAESNRVIEVTPARRVVREHPFKGPQSAQPLPNGNFLVTWQDATKVVEINPAGKIVSEIKRDEPGWARFWGAVRMKNGNTLVSCQKSSDWVVIEYDIQGRKVWEYNAEWSSVQAIQPLQNGNVLITFLSDRVIEIEKATNKIVWQLECKGVRDAFRTDSGNTLILTASKICEVNTDGVEVWSRDVKTVSGSIRKSYLPERKQPPGDHESITLISLSEQGKVIKLNEDLKEIWSFDCKYPMNAEKMENGNILIAAYGENRVIEVTSDKKVVREYRVRGLCSVRPVPNGNFLAVNSTEPGGSQVCEIDPNGDIVWKLKETDRQFYDAIRMENGNTLVTSHDRINGFTVAEYDPTGNSVSRVSGFGELESLDSFQLLKNGNVLLTFLSDQVLEVDRKTSQVVWKFVDEDIRDAFRLDNGNTLILQPSSCVLLEVDEAGKKVCTTPLGGKDHHGSVRQ